MTIAKLPLAKYIDDFDVAVANETLVAVFFLRVIRWRWKNRWIVLYPNRWRRAARSRCSS